jgi:hypothetical protein
MVVQSIFTFTHFPRVVFIKVALFKKVNFQFLKIGFLKIEVMQIKWDYLRVKIPKKFFLDEADQSKSSNPLHRCEQFLQATYPDLHLFYQENGMRPSSHVIDIRELQKLDSYKNDLELLKLGETSLTSVLATLPNRPMLALLLKTSTLTKEKCEELQTFPLPREISPFGFSIVGVPREFGCK